REYAARREQQRDPDVETRVRQEEDEIEVEPPAHVADGVGAARITRRAEDAEHVCRARRELEAGHRIPEARRVRDHRLPRVHQLEDEKEHENGATGDPDAADARPVHAQTTATPPVCRQSSRHALLPARRADLYWCAAEGPDARTPRRPSPARETGKQGPAE